MHLFQDLVSNQVISCKANGTHNFFRLTATKILIGSSRLDGMHCMELANQKFDSCRSSKVVCSKKKTEKKTVADQILKQMNGMCRKILESGAALKAIVRREIARSVRRCTV
jgi:hypothetical protein